MRSLYLVVSSVVAASLLLLSEEQSPDAETCPAIVDPLDPG
jgi:hypothetical protein